MTSPSLEPAEGPHRPHVAVLTMVRDEPVMLPRWVDYYAGEVGVQNLMVLDDNTLDGSTKDLPCTTLRLPPSPQQTFDKARAHMINGISRGLLVYFDVVIYTDVDEFIVPDPARYGGLLDYLGRHPDRSVIAPLGVNVLHNPRVEPDLDATQPVLAQRHFGKFVPRMCKPLLKRTPVPWLPGFHAVKASYQIDRDLLLFHLKYHDVSTLREAAAHRNALHRTEGRGSVRSAWAMGPDELTTRVLSWVGDTEPRDVPELDPGEPDLGDIVQLSDKGYFHSTGYQLQAMVDSPLRRLPERFSRAF